MKFVSTIFTTLLLTSAALAAPVAEPVAEAAPAPGYGTYSGYGTYAPPKGGYGKYGS